MARKRLTPPLAFGSGPADDGLGPLETKAMPFGPATRAVTGARPAPVERREPPGPQMTAPEAPVPDRRPGEREAGLPRAPISHIAGDSAAVAALEALAGEMAAVRASGRLVEALPLAAVDADHLVRDRVGFDEEDFRALVESLRQHGQRAPIEVVDLGAARGEGRYGLISGWRRLSALRRLAEETGEARFATVLALIRAPQGAGEAYVAMVEENEIRVGLSYYERARIAARAVEAGAFADRGAALRALYATASRAKRSKIGSFLAIHDALGHVLRFPAAIPERLGLALAGRLGEGGKPDRDEPLAGSMAQSSSAGPVDRLILDLAEAMPTTAEDEVALLASFAEGRISRAKQPEALASGTRNRPEIVPGICMHPGRMQVVLSGPGVDKDFLWRLANWLQGKGSST